MEYFDYDRQIEEVVKYIRSGETEDFKLGLEFEHFVIDKDSLRTISYYGENGVEESLRDMIDIGWTPEGEGDYVLGLTKGDKHITLEPGSQIELSVEKQTCIENLEKEYLKFLEDIIPILERKNQYLLTLGYHPVTKIDEIKILPKERYDHMFNYFKTKGTHAHNMMKGTASVQVTIDFRDEEDYIRKFQIANALSPVLYSIFENAYYFEGEVTEVHNMRSFIWENCDKDRSGIVEGALDKDFSYEKYAEYVLNRPPIFEIKEENIYSTGDKKMREVFDPENYKEDELSHLLTMYFPDVRTKKYLEIRVMDAVPYPLNFAAIALIKGLLYSEKNLDTLYEYIQDIDMEDIEMINKEMKAFGLGAKFKGEFLLDIARYLVDLGMDGLGEGERKYLLPLKEMLDKGLNPYMTTSEKDELGRREAIDWCIINHVVEG